MSIWQFAFHDNVKPEPPSGWAYDVHERLTNGEKLTREDKDRLFDSTAFQVYFQSSGIMPLAGWAFDFREFLNLYWIKFSNGDITEKYAPDKTSIRHYYSWPGAEIAKIVEIED